MDTVVVHIETFVTRICSKCGAEKESSEFYPSSNYRKDGTRLLRPECKVCSNPSKKVRGPKPTHKVCTKCGIDKDISEFFVKFYKTKKGRVQTETSQCKNCVVEVFKDSAYRARKNVARNISHRKDPRRMMLGNARRRAKVKNVPFSLTIDDIVIPEFCQVLGIKLEVNDGCPKPSSPTIDRIIPSLGYIKSNVEIISHRANTIKNNGSIEELRAVLNYMETFDPTAQVIDEFEINDSDYNGRQKKNPRWCIYRHIKSRAELSGIPISICQSDIVMPKTCPVFGVKLKFAYGPRAHNSASVDRFDNSKGYIPGNIVIISDKANRLKRDSNVSDLRAVIAYIERHLVLAV